MSNLKVLPNEGATEGRHLWRLANLSLALEAMDAKNLAEAEDFIAQSRIWPENLGVGKPYEVDESLEDLLAARLADKKGDKAAAETIFKTLGQPVAAPLTPLTAEIMAGQVALEHLGGSAQVANNLVQYQEAFKEDPFTQMFEDWAKDNRKGLKKSLQAWKLAHPNPNFTSREYYLQWLFQELARK